MTGSSEKPSARVAIMYIVEERGPAWRLIDQWEKGGGG